MKEEILNNKATKTIMAKDLGFDYSPLRVYVNENLTPAKRKLAKETRMSFKELGCSVWVRNSKILVARTIKKEEWGKIDKEDPKYKKYIVERSEDISEVKSKLFPVSRTELWT